MKRSKPTRILVIRLKPVGDTVLISAVFRNLKRLFPGSLIDVVIYPSALAGLGENPSLHRILVLKRKNLSKLFFYFTLIFRRYDITLDYINNPTSCLISLFAHAGIRIGRNLGRNFFYTHKYDYQDRVYSAIRSLYPLRFLGLKSFRDYQPEFFLAGSDLQRSDGILKKTGVRPGQKLIGIFVSAKYPARKYPAESFSRLACLIRRDFSATILFLFGLGDEDSIQRIRKTLPSSGRFIFIPDSISIGEMAGIMKKLKFLITNDTGPKHLATSLGIPTLTLFFSTDDKVWNPPDRRKFSIIRPGIVCSPCNKLKCDTLDCLNVLTPEEVYRKLKPALKRYLK